MFASSKRSVFHVLAVIAVMVFSFVAFRDSETSPAGTYPHRPIKLIVPFAAGGGTDTFARIIKKAIDDEHLLTQPLVIINIDGAGATIGSRRVKDAKPDGYTAMILHDAIVTAKYSGKATYGAEVFEPVAGTGEVGMVITVAADSPYKSLRDLMQAASQQVGELGFGANMGALTHFAGLQLEKAHPGARFQFAQIGGGAKRFSDLKGGHIDVTGFSIEEFVRFRPAGLHGLAYFGNQRHPAALDVPTAREQDYDIISSNTFYWWFPKGTPSRKIDTLATALKKAMQTDYVKGKMAEIHCEPIFIQGRPLRERIAATQAAISTIAPRPSITLPNLPVILSVAIAALVFIVFVTHSRPHQSSKPSAAKRDLEARSPKSRPGDPSLQTSGGMVTTESGTACQRDHPDAADSSASTHVSSHTPRPVLAAGCILVTAVYVAVLGSAWIEFRLATVTFVLAIGMTLNRWDTRHLAALAGIALVMGFGLDYLFTEVFVIDLP